MDWTTSLQKAITYMESHLLEDITAAEVAENIYISSFYFQKGFRIMTGYSVSEYIRNRRLYLAALESLAGNVKVIDLACKYGYDTPESFSKAFTRFHGVSPLQIRSRAEKIKAFLPLKITITVQGGNDMDYVVKNREGFQVIGFERMISYDTAYRDIPKFWDEFISEFCRENASPQFPVREANREAQKTVCSCMVGEYGICIDDLPEKGSFRYMIAGVYHGGAVPEGMTLYTLPQTDWAQFCCTGPLPGALQTVNTKIYSEWLPGNPDYEITLNFNIEWYSHGDSSSQDYESAIWIPVKRKSC